MIILDGQVLAIAHAAEGDSKDISNYLCVNHIVSETNCDILHEQGIEKVLLSLLETSSTVVSCCLAITALSNQLTTCKQLIGKEGNVLLQAAAVIIVIASIFSYR